MTSGVSTLQRSDLEPGPGVRLGGFLPFLIIFQATTHQA